MGKLGEDNKEHLTRSRFNFLKNYPAAPVEFKLPSTLEY